MIIKKAQSQIITTVLIILLVLAAVVIVWQVVNSTVREGTGELEGKVSCFSINMEVTGANLTHIKVLRSPGGSEEPSVTTQIFQNNLNTNNVTTGLAELGTLTFKLPSSLGDEIQIAPVLSDGTLCPLTGKETVVNDTI
tara:strand:- start:54 stop:470 length:417 start_codon:yes stop_codon:yes gene_type:complete